MMSTGQGVVVVGWLQWLLLDRSAVYRLCKTLSSMIAHLKQQKHSRTDLRFDVATMTGCCSDRDHRSRSFRCKRRAAAVRQTWGRGRVG
jgi:hypothetical protein